MKNGLYFLIFIALILVSSGCNLINPKEAVPFYISLPRPTIVDNNVPLRAKIGAEVVWIETGNDSIGYIPVPNTIPAIVRETKKYLFIGGVSELGQGFVGMYPMWQPFTRNIDIPIGDTLKMDSLVFQYYSDTLLSYPFVERFEDASVKFQKINGGQVELETYNGERFEGSYCGRANFNNVFTKMELLADVDAFGLPFDKPAYLEITYKSDIPFYAGLHYEIAGSGISQEVPLAAYIRESSTWNTVYLRLNNLMAKLSNDARNSSNYLVFFKTESDGSNKTLLIDNVRVVYRKK